MSKNEITGDRMVSKSSSAYSDNYDSIFRTKKVIYTVEYVDGFRDYLNFISEYEAQLYLEKHVDTIVNFEKQELLEG